MRIGIITYHRAVNPGAFLQAYALQRVIQNAGYEVEILEHSTPKTLKREFISYFYRNKGFKRIWEARTIVKYFLLQNQYFNLSRSFSNYDSEVLNQYDAVVLGSDEIWNYKNWFFGLMPLFFGVGVEKSKKISYAPSFGSIDINETLPEMIKQAIPKIDYLSVRDYHSQAIIQNNFELNPSVCLDPTLIYDFSQETQHYDNREDIFLVYSTEVSPENQTKIIAFCRQHNLKIVSLLFSYPWADKCYISPHPFKVIEWFKRSKYVFTNTFHGTLFSLRFADKFALAIGTGKKEKIDTIIQMFSLDNQIMKDNLETMFNQNFSLERSDILQAKKAESLNFLLNSLP